jgi:ribosomal protein S30
MTGGAPESLGGAADVRSKTAHLEPGINQQLPPRVETARRGT